MNIAGVDTPSAFSASPIARPRAVGTWPWSNPCSGEVDIGSAWAGVTTPRRAVARAPATTPTNEDEPRTRRTLTGTRTQDEFSPALSDTMRSHDCLGKEARSSTLDTRIQPKSAGP